MVQLRIRILGTLASKLQSADQSAEIIPVTNHCSEFRNKPATIIPNFGTIFLNTCLRLNIRSRRRKLEIIGKTLYII